MMNQREVLASSFIVPHSAFIISPFSFDVSLLPLGSFVLEQLDGRQAAQIGQIASA